MPILSSAGMRWTVLLLGVLAGLYGLALANYGALFLEAPPVRHRPLLYILPVMSLIGAFIALYAPAVAALFFMVSAAGWFGLGAVLGYGFAVTTTPLLLNVVAIGLAFACVGPRDIIASIDQVNTWIGKLFAFTVVILTVAVCYEVFMRYVMRAPTRWGYDAGYMLYGAGFIMAGAYALAQQAHVRADVIYRFWRPRTQAAVDLVLFLLFYFPAAFFFVYQGYIFAERSWAIREFSSASPFNIPVYHFKTLIPIAGVLLFVQGLAEVMRCVICLREGQWPPRLSDVEEIEKQALEGHVAVSIAGTVPTDQARELGLDVDEPPGREGDRR